MNRIFTSLILFMCALVGMQAAEIDYDIPESEVKTADPFILYDNGVYYLYGTRAGDPNKGFEVFTSTDLKLWKRYGYCIKTGHNLYWAPEVYKFDDKYYMYYSANHKLYVATSDSPLGPFTDVTGEPMLTNCGNTIDNSVFTDTLSDGTIQQWMFFVEENGANRIYRCKLNSDHVTCDESTVQKVLEADKSYELKVGYHCTEGPICLKKGNRYFLMYSANTYNNYNYCVCLATTTDLETNSWTKFYDNPVLNYQTLNNQIYGVGHHGWFIDKDGKYRIVFHGYKTSDCAGTRRVYIGTMNVYSRSIRMNLNDSIISPKLYLGGYDACDSLQFAVQAGTSVVADLNNDGHKDFIVAGDGGDNQGWINNTFLFDKETKTWSTHNTTLKTAYRAAIIPCDINLDGNIDILTYDSLGISSPATTTAVALAREGLFLGDGSGNFTKQELTFVDESGNATTFNNIAPETADVADFNNDGLPDIVMAGFRPNVQNANVVLLNQGNFTFKVVSWDESTQFYDVVVKAADFNNDGYMDFIVNGSYNNGRTPYTAIYTGNADTPGTFTLHTASGTGLRNLSNGTVQIADINNDGWLDLFIQGSSSNISSTSKFRQSVFLNKKVSSRLSFTEDKTSTATTSDNGETPRIQNSTPTSGGIIDWDGDGLFDLIVTGRCENMQTQVGFYYHNEDGYLMRDCVTSGGSGSTVAFPDWNGDGVRDFYNSGYSTDNISFNTDFKGRRSTVYYSVESAPQRPDAPTSLQSEGKAGEVTLSWTPATTAKDNTTYEYFVKDADGNLLTQTLSFIGGENDGVRKVDELGNACCNHSVKLTLPAGSYTWGVQAINASYDGSTFATSQIKVDENTVTGINAIVDSTAKIVGVYNLNGQKVDNDSKGFVIVKYADGKVEKLLRR